MPGRLVIAGGAGGGGRTSAVSDRDGAAAVFSRRAAGHPRAAATPRRRLGRSPRGPPRRPISPVAGIPPPISARASRRRPDRSAASESQTHRHPTGRRGQRPDIRAAAIWRGVAGRGRRRCGHTARSTISVRSHPPRPPRERRGIVPPLAIAVQARPALPTGSAGRSGGREPRDVAPVSSRPRPAPALQARRGCPRPSGPFRRAMSRATVRRETRKTRSAGRPTVGGTAMAR